jgi:hypothetical protein
MRDLNADVVRYPRWAASLDGGARTWQTFYALGYLGSNVRSFGRRFGGQTGWTRSSSRPASTLSNLHPSRLRPGTGKKKKKTRNYPFLRQTNGPELRPGSWMVCRDRSRGGALTSHQRAAGGTVAARRGRFSMEMAKSDSLWTHTDWAHKYMWLLDMAWTSGWPPRCFPAVDPGWSVRRRSRTVNGDGKAGHHAASQPPRQNYVWFHGRTRHHEPWRGALARK